MYISGWEGSTIEGRTTVENLVSFHCQVLFCKDRTQNRISAEEVSRWCR